MVKHIAFLFEWRDQRDATHPYHSGCGRRRGLGYYAGLLIIAALAAGCLSSCKTSLVQLRQQNASIVLNKYRARPLAAANNGRTVLGLHDCKRLALLNSLDLQTALWDEIAKKDIARSSKLRMLPKVEFHYELTQRDRPAWSRSDVFNAEGLFDRIGPTPGAGVSNYSTGRERFGRTWRVETKWSPMDAAMAKYLTRMRSNDAVHAKYQRVRAAQQLIGTVTAAFYRLRALNELEPKAVSLVANRQSIVKDVSALADQRLVEPSELVNAKNFLAEAKHQLEEKRNEIAEQREILAAAMNVCPDSNFQVAGKLLPLPPFSLDPCRLESVALVNRPEAYQADLSHLSSMAEHRRLIVKCFPRAEGFIGYFRDENRFTLNKNWIDGGLRVSWDLMQLSADILESKAAKDRVFKSDSERALISMALISQVRMKALAAAKAMASYNAAKEMRDGARENLRVAREVEETKDRGASRRIMRIARQKALCEHIQTDIECIMAVGDFLAALADLDVATGTNHPVNMAPPHPVSHPGGMACPGPAPSNLLQRSMSAVAGFLPVVW
ncbi:hypothetical protein ACFL2Q_11250 [Thermodesulfobacteriota bacterium]